MVREAELLARWGEECAIVRSMKRGARVYTCVVPYERHGKEEMEGACVCCRQTSLERFINRSVLERSCGDCGRMT